MWPQTKNMGPPPIADDQPAPPELEAARALMRQALLLLDEFSLSAAAASLDMAIHQLDREIADTRPE